MSTLYHDCFLTIIQKETEMGWQIVLYFGNYNIYQRRLGSYFADDWASVAEYNRNARTRVAKLVSQFAGGVDWIARNRNRAKSHCGVVG